METPCQTRNIPDISYLIRMDNVDCIQVSLHCSPLSISQLTMYIIIQELYVSQTDKTKERINLRLFCYPTATQIQPINRYHQETFLTFLRVHLKFLFDLRILFGWLVALLVSFALFFFFVLFYLSMYTTTFTHIFLLGPFDYNCCPISLLIHWNPPTHKRLLKVNSQCLLCHCSKSLSLLR